MYMKRLLIPAMLCWMAVFFINQARAQTVSPLVVECSKKCDGSFTVSNGSVAALVVTVEPFQVSLAPDGHSLFKPLDPGTEVVLNQSSARVGPLSDYTFDYKVRCATQPCMVGLASGMMVGKTPQGLAIRLVVPHIIYSCDKAKGCRAGTRLAAGLAN